MKRRLYIFVSVTLTLLLAGGLMRGLYLATEKVPLRKYIEPAHMNGVWDWRSATKHTTDELNDMALFLYRHQINTVFLDISAVIDGDSRSFDQGLQRYIEAMDKRGIKVFAAGGHTDWSKPDQRWQPEAIMDYVYAHNRRSPEMAFDGIELDIEAYNQKGFSTANMTERSRVLAEFMDMVDVLADKHQKADPGLELGFAIPYWFDNENKNIKSITWQSKTGPMLYHLADRLNQLPKSNLVIMAYRNATRGNDGTAVHSQTEVEYAKYKANRVKIVIGQETTQVEPAKITFYGLSMTEFSREARLIAQAFGLTGQYGGIAINDLEGFMNLRVDSAESLVSP